MGPLCTAHCTKWTIVNELISIKPLLNLPYQSLNKPVACLLPSDRCCGNLAASPLGIVYFLGIVFDRRRLNGLQVVGFFPSFRLIICSMNLWYGSSGSGSV